MMIRHAWILAGAVALAGCKKEKSSSDDGPDLGPQRDGSALWKLAPEGTEAGVVVAPGALVDLHQAAVTVAASLKSVPAGNKAIDEIRAETTPHGVDPFAADGLEKTGLDLKKGLAVFFAAGGEDAYAIVPVADRAAFVKLSDTGKSDGELDRFDDAVCRISGDHYRCAPTEEKLAAWKPAAEPPDAAWPKELRGSIEVLVGGELLAGAEPIEATMESATRLLGALQIQRGAALVRYRVEGKAKKMLAVGETPLADAAKKAKPAALFVGHGQALIDLSRREIGGRIDEKGPGGVTPGKLLDALTGEIVAFAPAGGPPRGFVQIGIRDPEPFRALTVLCGMAPPLGPGIKVSKTDNGCAFEANPPGMAGPIRAALELENEALVVSIGDASAGRESSGGTALPRFVRESRWLGALWMRGSMIAAADALPHDQLRGAINEVPELAAGLWAYAHLSELGMGVGADDTGVHGFFRIGTTWANPPEVVEELEPLIARFTKGDFEAVAKIRELGEKHPKTPLGRDIAAGSSGAGVAAASVGVLAAVAIPAFMKYIKKSKSSEPRMLLTKLQQGAMAHRLGQPAGSSGDAEASFPEGSTPITPPLGTCCAAGDKCAPQASYWESPTWTQLQFSIDYPHYYSYQYERSPDGQSFTVRAFGDLDCDGQYSTFEMVGTANGPGGPMRRENEYE